ncbi:AAA family ATPase [Maribacter aurantiacus]|uniref:AAA family ATPase n=1 Tax=Maribacter aurantiacus TaxID=1882343 RepID=UPI00137622EC|nr:AAA family ATPase [Maribacter aurantiacus]
MAAINSEFAPNNRECVYYFKENQLLDENPKNFGKLSTINLFIGTNNSGKSRFLRGLLKIESSFIKISSKESHVHLESIADNIVEFYNSKRKRLFNLDNQLCREVDSIFQGLQLSKDPYRDFTNNYGNKGELFKEAKRTKLNISKELEGKNLENLNPFFQGLVLKLEFLELVCSFSDELDFVIKKYGSHRVYLPIMRSIKRSANIEPSIFRLAVSKLYGVKEDLIFSGLDLYNKVLRIRNNVKEERRGFEKFEKFLSKYFFHGDDVEIISSLDKEEHLIFYVGDDEKKIHDIGDGIQSIILLMFPIFTAQENTWVFIDEPETHLHPGLQKVFLETLLYDEYLLSKNLIYFFTTHSNHFLDLTINSDNISIFQFEKENKEKFKIKNNVKPDREVLDLLGVSNSSVFLANTSLWVEGPTDRKYLSFFLKKYCEGRKKQYLKEDIDFAFFEYGGNLIAHYLFDKAEFEADETEIRSKINSFALSNKIFLLADEDNSKGNTKKGQRRIALENLSEKSNNFLYQNTELREIENLLPKKVIKEFMKEIASGSKLESIDFRKSDYDKLGLGSFYENLFKANGIEKKNQKAFLADSGTLKNDYKIKLCEFTINSNLSYEDLTLNNPILDKLITDLYNFILK